MATAELTPIELTAEILEGRRVKHWKANQVAFRVSALYGLTSESVRFPLSEEESIDSGLIAFTLDPEARENCNVGIIDFAQMKMGVTYGVQIVFPGLYDLVTREKHDPSLLNPIRATATDDCSLTPDAKGWRAAGCLDFLPGSLWSGAKGG